MIFKSMREALRPSRLASADGEQYREYFEPRRPAPRDGAMGDLMTGASAALSSFAPGVDLASMVQPFVSDAAGIADRFAARAELADRFEIVDAGSDEPRAPNQITAEELDEVATLYSNIRLGRGDLQIDAGSAPDADDYRAGVLSDIADVLQTRGGRELISTLSDNVNTDDFGQPIHRTTTIQPHLDASGALDYSRAEATTFGGPGFANPFADGRPGIGSNAYVGFNPIEDTVREGAHYRSDVALFHELVHARDDTSGTLDYSRVNAVDDAAHAAARFDFGAAFGHLMDPSPEIRRDANAGIRRAEHSAVGLGLYADAPISENAYRAERRAITGVGRRGGDRELEGRDAYKRASR